DFVADEFPKEQLAELSQSFVTWGVDDTDRLVEILWMGYERLRKSDFPRLILDTTIIRATRIPLVEDIGRLIRTMEVQGPSVNSVTSATESIARPSAPPPPRPAPQVK